MGGAALYFRLNGITALFVMLFAAVARSLAAPRRAAELKIAMAVVVEALGLKAQ